MKRLLIALSCVATVTLGLNTAIADETNPHIVHRQGLYKVLAGHLTAMKSIIFLDHSATDDLTYHAKSIRDTFTHFGNAFPEGSDFGETKAKADIWEDREAFKEKGKNAMAAAENLVKATERGDKGDIADAFKKMVGACKSCHDDFREK